MSDHDPLYNHAALVARLQRVRVSGPATFGDHHRGLSQLAARYDFLADTMGSDAHILDAMRAPLLAALDQGIGATSIYDTLTHVGLSISRAHFTRIIAKLKHARHSSSKAAMTAEQWATLLAPVLTGTPTAARYRAVCAPLQEWGARITATGLRRGHLCLTQQQDGRPTALPVWSLVLDQFAARLVDLARIGCSPADIAACLKRRHLPVPENEIAEWLRRALPKQRSTQARRATQTGNDLHDKNSAVTEHQFSITVDPVIRAPFQVTVRCMDSDGAGFARTWLGAGVRAITAQLGPETAQAEPDKPSSKASPRPARAERSKKPKKEGTRSSARTRSA
jgi:hypothetical protein